MGKLVWFVALVFGIAVVSGAPVVADTDRSGTTQFAVNTVSFKRWVERLWPQAKARGVTRRVFDAAFAGVKPDPRVQQADANQPEFVKPVWEYLDRAVSERKIANGRARLGQHDATLKAISRRYGVDHHYLVAIWGIESGYGRNTGSHNVIQALASMGYNGRRSDFARKQLLAALEILQKGDTTIAALKGSWAGAMGHTQFIPTTFNAYAVDFNGDGRRDIWHNMSDALASAANYLKVSGWQSDMPWGYEVALPQGFDYGQTGLGAKKLTAEWVGLGVKRIDGKKFGQWALEASIIVPAGAHGPAFIVFQNFRTIMRYNNSVSYALAVSHLSDRLNRGHTIKQAWPKTDRPLSSKQTMELQQLLQGRGYAVGEIDGRLGPATRAALRHYQHKAGLVPDGYPSETLLRHLRGKG